MSEDPTSSRFCPTSPDGERHFDYNSNGTGIQIEPQYGLIFRGQVNFFPKVVEIKIDHK